MKRWKVAILFLLLSIFCMLEITSANTGVPPLGQTNAPGEQNCAACHDSFKLNGGTGSINLFNVPLEYRPGQIYNFEVVMQDPDSSSWGFQLTALNNKGQKAGTIRAIDSVNTELRVSGNRDYLASTLAGNFAGLQQRVTWQFEWTAPNQDMGTVIFYTSGVAGNLDRSPRGDKVYSSTASIRVLQVKTPTINFISPNRGSAEGNTKIMLRGEGYREGLTITFDGIDAQGEFVNETTATAISPQHKEGTVDIRILNTDGSSFTSAQIFTYDPPPPPAPKAFSITPNNGPTTGGVNARLNGDNFQPGARVIFDGKELPTTFVNTNFLSFRIPLHNPGSVNIVVVNPDGQRVELTNAFNFEGPIPSPVIKLLTPVGGEVLSAGGAPVSITWSIESNGTPFQRLLLSTDGGATFPVVLASGLSSKVNSFKLIMPEEFVSDRVKIRLEVVQPEATVIDDSNSNLKIVRAPVLVKVTPATAKSGKERLDLEITGEGFSRDSIVEIDGVKLKATFVSSTSIKIKKAPHNVPGLHFIRVRSSNGGVSRNFLFTVAQ